MRSSETTIAEVFKSAGYSTGIFGKWHNGSQYPHIPRGQGFDEFFGFAAGHWNNYFDTELEHNGEIVKTKGFITDVLTDKAIEFINTNKEKPFFCYIPYNAPHGPFQVPDKYFDKYKALGLTDKNAAVYGMNENIDDNFQRILNTLDDSNIRENTIVIFLTDNGPNGKRYNGNMRGTKASVHEGGVRVPLFVQWPDKFKIPKTIKPITSHIDLMPTLVDLCDIELKEDLVFDGRSLMPLLLEQEKDWQPREIYSIQNDGKDQDFPSSVRTEQYRLVKDRNQNISLYDMVSDPSQEKDIALEFPEIRNALRHKLESWYKEVAAGGYTPERIEIGYPESPIVELPAHESILNGNLAFKGKMGWANDWIINWTSSGDSATWDIRAVNPGNYKISALYTNSASPISLNAHSGSQDITKEITSIHNPPTHNSPDRIPRGEVYEKDWAKIEVGEIMFTKGNHFVSITVLDTERLTGLEIKGIEIEPL